MPDYKSMIPGDYPSLCAKIESNNRPYVKAPTSSASGLYQFIQKTWTGLGGKWGDKSALAFGGLTPPIAEQIDRFLTFTAGNVPVLLKGGLAINKASLYAAHFLGPAMAVKLCMADVNASAEDIAGPAATAANKNVLDNKTVGQFLSWLHYLTGDWAR